MASNSLVYNIIARDKTGPALAKASANIQKSAFKAAGATALLGAKVTALAAGAAVAAAAVAPAAGAIALLPAAGFGAAAGIGTLVAAFQNLGDAMGATEPEEKAEALKKLAPAGREVAKAVWSVKPAWQAMQRAIQESTFKGVGKDLRLTSNALLPSLRKRLVEVGAAWNVGIRESLKLVRSKQFVKDTDTALGNAAKATRGFARAIAPVISGLRHIGVVGSKFLPAMGNATLSLAQRFERWAAAARSTGRMESWIRTGLQNLKQWKTIAGNVVGIMTAIFRGGSGAAGRTFREWLLDTTTRMREFLESTRGQEKITKFFDVLGRLVRGAAGAWQAFTAEGTPVFSMLSLIYRIVRPLVDDVEDLGPAIGRAAALILPALVSFKALGLAFGVIRAGAALATKAVKGFSGAATATPWGAIAAGAYGLGYALGYVIDNFDTIAPKIRDLTFDMLGIHQPQWKAAKGTAAWSGVLKILDADVLRVVRAMNILEGKFQDQITAAKDSQRASIGWEQAIDDVAASARENGRSLDINTQAGRNNQTAILGAVEAAWELRNANIASGMKTGEANKIYQDSITKLQGVGEKAGYAKDQLKKITGKYNIDIVIDTKLMGAFAKAISGVLPGWLGQAIQNAASKGLKLPGRAAGGPVQAGMPYWVGERGRPELFVPGQSGAIKTEQQVAAARPTTTAGGDVIRLEVGGNAAGLERVFLGWLLDAFRKAGIKVAVT